MIVIERKMDHATLAATLRGAFKADAAYRVEFPAGLTLYKVTHGKAATQGGTIAVNAVGRVTEWWFSYESLTIKDPRFETITIRGVADVVESANRSIAGFQQYLRSRGAVCRDWNVMTHLLVVELRRRVVGLMGTCSGQPIFDNKEKANQEQVANVSFIGGEQQFYLPGLTPGDVRVRRFGKLD